MNASTSNVATDGTVTARRDLRPYVFPIAVTVATIAVVVVGAAANPEFVTFDNGLAIMRSASLVGIVGLGATFVTLSGRLFSLALAQTAVFCGISFSMLMREGTPFVLAIVLTVAIGALIGAVQGGAVAMGANPIVTTLGAGALLAGLAGLVTGGQNIRFQSEAATWLGNARPLGVPTQTWAFVLLTAVAWWVLTRTRIGRSTLLTGANRLAARGSGVSVWRVTLFAFVVASAGAAIAALFGASQFSQARINEYAELDFSVIAAVLVGGTAIQGGEGSPLRTALGAVFIAMVGNFMLLLGWSFGVRSLILGLLIGLAVVSYHLLRRRAAGGGQ